MNIEVLNQSLLGCPETLGFDGTSKAHVDKILQEIFKDKSVQVRFILVIWYPYQGNKRLEFIVYDIENNFFSLSVFDITKLSQKAVLIYRMECNYVMVEIILLIVMVLL